MRPLEDYVGPNIVSAHEILRLASRGRAKAVHVVSTISTIPLYVGLGLTEEDQEYGCGTSKFLHCREADGRGSLERCQDIRLPVALCYGVDHGGLLPSGSRRLSAQLTPRQPGDEVHSR